MTRTKKKSKIKNRRRLLFLCTGSIVLIVVLCLAVGNCWVEIFDKYQEKRELENKLVELKEKEEELKVDVKKMQDPDYVARYAREKYLYSKDGEIVIQIPDDEESSEENK
ncbi:MAG: septum formation initiator family protein [Bacilli bacterium]